MDRDSIKGRIRKLLNIAADNAAAEGEIENALKFAERLMAQHQISRAELDVDGDGVKPSPSDVRMTRQTAYGGSQKKRQWEVNLAYFICDVVGSIQYYTIGKSPKRNATGLIAHDDDGEVIQAFTFQFYGDVEGCVVAVELFNELTNLITTMTRLRYGAVDRCSGREYAEGFVKGLWDRLHEQRSARLSGREQVLTLPSGESSAIIPVSQMRALTAWNDRVRQAANAWLRDECKVKLRSGSSTRTLRRTDANAREIGYRDGKATDASTRRRRSLPGGR